VSLGERKVHSLRLWKETVGGGIFLSSLSSRRKSFGGGQTCHVRSSKSGKQGRTKGIVNMVDKRSSGGGLM